jgi:hypothetical protein
MSALSEFSASRSMDRHAMSRAFVVLPQFAAEVREH